MIIDALATKANYLGRLGENKTRVLRFDVSEVLSEFPDATLSILHKRSGDSAAYPVPAGNYTVDGPHLLWTITSGDVAMSGVGLCEIIATEGEKIVKSTYFTTIVEEALDGSGTPPDPWTGWVQEVTNSAERAEEAAQLLENPGAETTTLPAGSEATVSYSDGTFSFGIPRGQDGTDGKDGVDGKDGKDGVDGKDGLDGKDGKDGVDGKDGQDGAPGRDGQDGAPGKDGQDGAPGRDGQDGAPGQDGKDGQDGVDGFSPTATVTKSGHTTTISITDKNGTTEQTIEDGTTSASWELINDITLSEDSELIQIAVDSIGNPFELTDVIAVFTCGPSTTGNRDSFYGYYWIKYDNNGVNVSGGDSFPSLTFTTATSSMVAKIQMTTNYPAPINIFATTSSSTGATQQTYSMPKDIIATSITGLKIYQSGSTKSLVPSGARLRLWGKRIITT